MRSSNIGYLPAVDHLRAYAALLVLAYHGLHVFSHRARFGGEFTPDHWLQPGNPLLAALAEGHTAVALFMVLSGFILTCGALDRAVDWRGFIRNRLLRTYPLFLLLVFAGIAAVPEQFQWLAFLQTVGGFANLPGALSTPPFSSMLWTIAVEWQFYVIFPLLLAVAKPAWSGRITGMVLVLVVVRGLAVLAGGSARDIGYLTILGRLDQFLIGMWAAWCFRRHPLGRRAATGLAILALAAMLAALALSNRAGGWPTSPPWKVLWPTVEAVGWAAFLLGYVQSANAARGAWSRLVAAVGTVSYSIYLTHFVVIHTLATHGWLPFASGHVVRDALLNTLLVALPPTLLLATLTYAVVERPFLRLRGTYHRGAALPGAAHAAP